MTSQAVNLLPWRAREERRRQRTYFLTLAMSIIIPCFGASLLHWEKAREVDRLRSEISGYRMASEQLEEIKDERELLISRIAETEAWLADYEVFFERRLLLLKLWTELAQHLPDSMHYQTIELDRSSLTLTGTTNSSPDLATYMRRLEASSVFDSPRLIDLEDTPSGQQFGIDAGLARVADT